MQLQQCTFACLPIDLATTWAIYDLSFKILQNNWGKERIGKKGVFCWKLSKRKQGALKAFFFKSTYSGVSSMQCMCFFIHNQDLLYTFPLSFLCFDIKASKNSIWIPAKVWQALFPSNIQSQRRKYWRCEKNHPNFPRLDVIALVMSSLLACPLACCFVHIPGDFDTFWLPPP